MGAWLFTHRLLTMAAAFMVALCTVVLWGHTTPEAWWWAQLWALDGRMELPQRTLALSGLGCVVAFAVRTSGETHLGAAVYAQGPTEALRATGPYARVRNPLYTGTWLFFVSAVVLWAPAVVWLALCILFALALHLMVRHEEQLLLGSLGAPYAAYLETVPRWVPSLGQVPKSPAAPWAQWRWSALGNVGLLSLGLYRLAVVVGVPGEIPGAVNVVLLLVWLGVVLRRRWYGQR